MSSTYSSYKIELMATGDQSGLWGATTNTNLGTAIEQAIGGYASQAMSDATTTITLTNTNAAQNARALYLNLTGALTAARDLVVPAIQKSYIIKNSTTGGFAVTVKVSGMTGVSVPNGRTMHLYNNGTDVVLAFDYVSLNSAYISGNVGIGTAAPGYKFDLRTTGNSTLGQFSNTGTSAGDDAYLSINSFAIGGTDTKSGILLGDGDSPSVGRIVYSHTDDTMAFYTLGSARMRINDLGYVGIGATTPLFKLDVQGTGSDTFFRHLNTGTAASDDSIISIQTSSTGATATLSGIYFGDGDSQTVGRIWYSHASDNMQFFTSGTLQAVIDSSGYMLLGYGGSNGAYRLQVNSQIFATNATIATSDGRYKENVQALERGVDTVLALRPVTFTWKDHPVHNFPVGETDVGFIAQEVAVALGRTEYGDSVVRTNNVEGESFLGMADTKLIPVLVRAVQELYAQVVDLTRQIEEMRP